MSKKNEIPPQVSIYTNKMLFDQNDDRNKKRMAQMLKRKKIIFQNKKEATYDKTCPSTQDTCQNINSFLSQFKNELTKNPNKNSKKLYHSSFQSKNSVLEFSSINVNFENFYPFFSQELSPKFNESTKEINISNISDLTNENYKSPEKIKSDKNFISKIKEKDNSINVNNKFALTYLSSHLNSFISLKNKLTAKAKYENNFFTTSYSLALFNDEIKKTSPKKSSIQEIILEEPESPSPNHTPSKNIFSLLNYVKPINTAGKIRSILLKPESYSHIKCLTNINNSGNSESLINNSKLKIPKNKLVLELKKKLIFKNKKYNNSTILNKKNIDYNKSKVINNNKVINKNKTTKGIEKYARLNKFMKTQKRVYKNNLVKKHSLLINNSKEDTHKSNSTKKEVSFNIMNNLITKETKNKNQVPRSKSQNKISKLNKHENLTHKSKCYSNLSNNSNIFEKNYNKTNKSYSQKIEKYQRNNDRLKKKNFYSKNKNYDQEKNNSLINKKPTINGSWKINSSIFDFLKLYRKIKSKKADIKISLIKSFSNTNTEKLNKKGEVTCSIKKKRTYKINKPCYILNKQQKAKTYFIFYFLIDFISKYSG